VARDWLDTVDSVVALIGSDAWQDMTMDEYTEALEDAHPLTRLILWDAMQKTLGQITRLPESS
jgi:hypothetical protein